MGRQNYSGWRKKRVYISDCFRHGGDKVDQRGGIFNAENANNYGQYVGKRYETFPNIIWINGGDRSGGGDNMPIWDALARGIKSKDTNHLMTFHPLGRNTSSTWFHDRKWLDFNSCHHYTYDIFEKLISGDYNKQPIKPIINLEPCYEDHPVRSQPKGVYICGLMRPMSGMQCIGVCLAVHSITPMVVTLSGNLWLRDVVP